MLINPVYLVHPVREILACLLWILVSDCQGAVFESDGDRRAVGDLAGEERSAEARFEFALEESLGQLQGARSRFHSVFCS